MNNDNKKIALLGQAPITKALLAMGLPTMIGMMINALYNLVDAYFVGGLGTRQMGAISVVFPLSQIVVGMGLLFGSGAASYISRLLGHHEKNRANQVASTALFGSIALGLILVLISIAFLRPILIILGATESILPYAIRYGRIYVFLSIFNIFNVTMNSLVTSEGAAKITMYAMLAGALLNVALDPIFIYFLNFGVAGAAIATGISQICSTLIYLFYIASKKSVFSFSVKACHFSKEILSEIFKIGIPTLVFQLLTSLSISLINLQAKPFGDSVIAGMGAVTRIVAMGSLMVFGFIKGFQPIAGYNYGAKNFSRLEEAVKKALLWSTLFCAIFGVITAFFADSIIAQFTLNDVNMIEVGSQALIANGLSFICFGFYTVYSSLLLALGKGKAGFFLGSCRQGICFVPLITLLPKFWGLNGILYAQPIADMLSAVITIFMAKQLHNELDSIKTNLEASLSEPD